MNALQARIPPPVVGVLAGVLAWLASRAGGPATLPPGWRLPAAAVLVLAGAATSVAGVRAVRGARTTLDPLRPETASALVTTGIYARTRNPMYLGVACLLLAWAAWLGTVAALAGPVAFVFYMDRFQVTAEERALARLFGAQYEDYRTRVRRWL